MTRGGLASLKVKALRHRFWFALSRLERGVVDLTIRYVDEIKSEVLSLVIGRIVCKILKALRSPFLAKAERVEDNEDNIVGF
jgi:ribosome-associated toxin RatA of RatAB toxin-antitoxin module